MLVDNLFTLLLMLNSVSPFSLRILRLRNGATQQGLDLPLSIDLINSVPSVQSYTDIPSLKFSSEVILGSVRLLIKANYHIFVGIFLLFLFMFYFTDFLVVNLFFFFFECYHTLWICALICDFFRIVRAVSLSSLLLTSLFSNASLNSLQKLYIYICHWFSIACFSLIFMFVFFSIQLWHTFIIVIWKLVIWFALYQSF